MSRSTRLSDLSPARQALVRLCLRINHGSIEDLEVRRSEPVFDPAPVVLRDVRLDADEGPRPELALGDFALGDEVCRLMRLLDKLESGTRSVLSSERSCWTIAGSKRSASSRSTIFRLNGSVAFIARCGICATLVKVSTGSRLPTDSGSETKRAKTTSPF